MQRLFYSHGEFIGYDALTFHCLAGGWLGFRDSSLIFCAKAKFRACLLNPIFWFGEVCDCEKYVAAFRVGGVEESASLRDIDVVLEGCIVRSTRR